jgi:hypothetical protein
MKTELKLWRKARSGGELSEEERELMRQAYWEDRLPDDLDFDVYQWVEDGMHPIS